MQRSRELPSKNKRSFVTCDEKWTKRSARVAPRENASESDTMEHVALCRVIKRNVVTRTNSKRWRYWASVQGYAPCSCCLKPFTPSFLLRNSSSPPSFFLSVGHISAVFIIRLVFLFLRLYVSSLRYFFSPLFRCSVETKVLQTFHAYAIRICLIDDWTATLGIFI